MKKLIILFSVLFMAIGANTFAQEKKEEPEFATLVIYRDTKQQFIYSLDINNINITNLPSKSICYFKLYSKGSLLLTFKTTHFNIDITDNDTLYLYLNVKIGNVIHSTITLKTKADFENYLKENSKVKFNYFKASERIDLPYNPGSFTSAKPKEKSGTGFLISDKGYIVTNHHVIDNADKITISGVNGNFNSELSAKVVLKDEASDLALLKIEDRILIDPIPYVIIPEQIAIGENVFLLGFPYIKTMGTDVKLTNGIVSSKSGYEGNINSYQVSAPVQPGNSGGPVFDANGRIIAIVNAKHTLAENASYAIKSKYLLELLENLDEKIELNKTNQLEGLSLPQQVEKAQQFVVIIKTK